MRALSYLLMDLAESFWLFFAHICLMSVISTGIGLVLLGLGHEKWDRVTPGNCEVQGDHRAYVPAREKSLF